MTTAVVILNWNGKKMLERFLPSVTAHTQGDAEVIIADNGSTDDSLDFVRAQYPGLRIIELDKNYGFAGGYNRALQQVKADYYVLLNDDVEVTPGWIEPVVAQMQQHPDTAICQPKLLMYDQRDTFEYAGGAGGFLDKYGYPAMFVRADVWHQLGGLDDDFFAHMEEIDFCWRAKNAGYRVEYCPQSTVFHVGGGTLPKSNPRKTYLNFRNNMALLYKNLPKRRLAWVMCSRIVLDYVAGFKFLMERKPKEFSAVVDAHKAFYKWLPQLKKKRQGLKQQSRVSGMYQGLLLIDYYLLGKKKYSDLKFK